MKEVTKKHIHSDTETAHPKKCKNWMQITAVLLLIFCISLIVGVICITKLPTYKKLCNSAYDTLATMEEGTFRKLSNTQIFDKDEKIIGEVNSGNYEYRPIADIPLHLQNAYIAAEDQTFKTHHGIDLRGIVRAGIALIKNRGEITQGGSTITQQVIKNNLLTQEQTFVRKILEILIAPELEKKYSKQEIMEFYCNSNYYGNGCYGVGNAAKFYFGKDLKELSLGECAMIAGISNSPNNYNPIASIELSTKKKNSILTKMHEQGMISEAEMKQAKKQEIVITQTEKDLISSNNYMSSYAIHCAALELMEQEGFQFQYLFSSQESFETYQKKYDDANRKAASLIRGGGYRIYTAIDMTLQKQLQSAVDQQLANDKEIQDNGKYQLQGAAVTIDNATGYVVAIVGGRGENDQFNRGFLAERQPGSTIKPLLDYGPAFDLAIATPSSIYNDHKLDESYSPKNANGHYLGDMNLRRAIALSTNTIAYQVFQQVGQEQGLKYLEKMKFHSLCFADTQAPSISLGGFTTGVTVDDMARGYAVIANHGKDNGRSCLRKIEHEKDGLIYDGEKEARKQIYSQDAAYMLTDAMQGVFRESYGTGSTLNLNGHIASGKTGTTNSNRDSWLCGFTKYYTTAVWTGRDDNSSLSNTSYALKIWQQFMNAAHTDKPVVDFDVPDTIEYRNVIGGGRLGDKVYPSASLDMSKCAYDRRPEGYDLYSQKNAEKLEKNQNAKDRKQKLDAAEKAVKEFEAYEINSIDTAKGMEKAYTAAHTLIEEVQDMEKQFALKTRLAAKHSRLQKTYESWTKKIAEADANAEKQRQNEQKIRDEKNEADAVADLHEKRIGYMEEFINLMKRRQYNTTAAQQLIEDAGTCLENCKGYAEYNDLKAQYDAQVARINSLPNELLKPEIPENGNDVSPDSGDYPEETVPNPVPPSSEQLE